jgi:hypothetical protein
LFFGQRRFEALPQLPANGRTTACPASPIERLLYIGKITLMGISTFSEVRLRRKYLIRFSTFFFWFGFLIIGPEIFSMVGKILRSFCDSAEQFSGLLLHRRERSVRFLSNLLDSDDAKCNFHCELWRRSLSCFRGNNVEYNQSRRPMGRHLLCGHCLLTGRYSPVCSSIYFLRCDYSLILCSFKMALRRTPRSNSARRRVVLLRQQNTMEIYQRAKGW